MDSTIIYIIIGAVAIVAGILLGKVIFAKNTQKNIEEAEAQSQKIITEGRLKAETFKKEKELEAKERFVQLKSEHDKDVLQRNQKINEGESRIRQKSKA